MGSLFKILTDVAGEISFSLTKLVKGQAVDNQVNGIAGYSFVDKDGNAIMPQLNNEGAVVVSFDAGTCIRGNGKVLKGALTKDVETEIGKITLNASKEYTMPSFVYSTYRDIQFRVALVDDAAGTPVETNIYEGVLGGAEVYEDVALKKDCFPSGSTGVQELKLYATPKDNPDDIFVQMSVNELA